MERRIPWWPLAFLAWSAAHAGAPVTLSFDDVNIGAGGTPYAAPLPPSYGGLDWGATPELYVANTDAYALFFRFTAASGNQAVFHGLGAPDIEVRLPDRRFDFLGAQFRTWGSAPVGTVSFSGWEGETKRFQAGPFVIDREFRPIDLHWHGIDRLVIESSMVYLMDNFRYAAEDEAAPPAPQQAAGP